MSDSQFAILIQVINRSLGYGASTTSGRLDHDHIAGGAR